MPDANEPIPSTAAVSVEHAASFQKDMLLSFLWHYMPMEVRQRVMHELPHAYNAYCGEEIMRTENNRA